MKNFLALFLLIICFCNQNHASPSQQDAESFISSHGNKTIQDLTSPGLDSQSRRTRFNQYLNSYFTVERICQNLVGRYWRNMAPQQKSQFVTLYKKMIENIFISKFQEYQGASLLVTGSKKVGNNVQVFTDLSLPGKSPSKVIWLVSSGLKILDIQLAGLSIFRAHRDDFRNSLSSNGGNVDRFLSDLSQKAN